MRSVLFTYYVTDVQMSRWYNSEINIPFISMKLICHVLVLQAGLAI